MNWLRFTCYEDGGSGNKNFKGFKRIETVAIVLCCDMKYSEVFFNL